MMSCAEAARLMSDEMQGAINVRTRFSLRMHLMMCSGCQQYRKQLAQLRRWLMSGHLDEDSATQPESMRLEDSARERIQNSLQVEMKRTQKS